MPGKNAATDLDDDDDDDDLRELNGNRPGAQELAEDAEARAADNNLEGEHVVIEEEDDDDKNDERVGSGVEGERTDRRRQEAQPGRGRENETAEQRTERRRNERKAAKQRQQAARNRDKAELNFLRGEVDRLHAGQAQLRQGQLVTQAQGIDSQLSYIEENIRKADSIIADGVNNQNGEDVAKAQGIRERLVQRRNQLIVAKSRLQEGARRAQEDNGGGQPVQRQRPPNPLVVAQFQNFIQRNDWFDPQGGDENSAVVLAIDNALTEEGEFDPATPAYWKELEKRVKRRIPEAFEATDDDDDDDLDDEDDRRGNGRSQQRQNGGRQPQRRSGGGPRMPSNAGGGGGGPKTFYLSAERKAAMIEAGVWDDVKLRNKYIKQYQKWDAANASSGR